MTWQAVERAFAERQEHRRAWAQDVFGYLTDEEYNQSYERWRREDFK